MEKDTANTELCIKNMVCPRCIEAVKHFLERQHYTIISIELGKAVIKETISKEERNNIAIGLKQLDFKLLDDKKEKTIEQIKNIVVDFVHYQENNLRENLSDYIVSKLHQDYSTLSKIFSENEKMTIEKYFILQKIEKIKELLSYGELNLNEIAFKLNYSSPAYLSAQFKKVTGLTPSQYKNSTNKNRKSLDSI